MSALEERCALCDAVAAGTAVASNDHGVLMPDAFPLNPGHHLAVSRRHEPDYFALTADEQAALWMLVSGARVHIRQTWQPNGYNIGVNIGPAAGQTIGHVHVHVIPRYDGDCEDPRGGIRWILPDRARYWAG